MPAITRQDAVAVALGVLQTLEQKETRAFADYQAVGAGVEGRATSARRQGAELRKSHLRIQAIGTRHAAGQHGVGTSAAQLIHRQFQGVQRRGAGGVERVTTAAETERLGQHSRDEAGNVAIQRRARGVGLPASPRRTHFLGQCATE